MGTRSIKIQASASTILEVIADLPGQLDWTPATSLDVLKADTRGRPLLARWQESYAPMLDDEFEIEYTWGDNSVEWNLTKGRILKKEYGRYDLTENDDGSTTVDYELVLGIAIWVAGFVRGPLENLVIKSALEGLKARVEMIESQPSPD